MCPFLFSVCNYKSIAPTGHRMLVWAISGFRHLSESFRRKWAGRRLKSAWRVCFLIFSPPPPLFDEFSCHTNTKMADLELKLRYMSTCLYSNSPLWDYISVHCVFFLYWTVSPQNYLILKLHSFLIWIQMYCGYFVLCFLVFYDCVLVLFFIKCFLAKFVFHQHTKVQFLCICCIISGRDNWNDHFLSSVCSCGDFWRRPFHTGD